MTQPEAVFAVYTTSYRPDVTTHVRNWPVKISRKTRTEHVQRVAELVYANARLTCIETSATHVCRRSNAAFRAKIPNQCIVPGNSKQCMDVLSQQKHESVQALDSQIHVMCFCNSLVNRPYRICARWVCAIAWTVTCAINAVNVYCPPSVEHLAMKSSVIDQMRNLDQYHHSTQNAVNRKNATKNRAKNVARKIKIAKNVEIIRNADVKIKIKCAINKPVNVKMDSLEIGAVCAFHWRMPT